MIQGCFFLPGVAAVDDVGRPSAVCASEFGREDGEGVKRVGRRPGSGLRRAKLAMSNRPSVRELAYLGMITVVALTIAVIVASEINHLLWKGQDLPHGRGSPSSSRVRSITCFEEAKIRLTQRRSSSSAESKISPSSEGSAAQAGGSGWPTAGDA